MEKLIFMMMSLLLFSGSDTESGFVSAKQLKEISQEGDFESLASRCAPEIHVETLKALVRTESNYNPYAIGVVNGRLKHQPGTFEEALRAVKELDRKGYNYSVGLGQINKTNFEHYGESAATLFEPCRNLKVSGSILKKCYELALTDGESSQGALLKALSCYYSGNFRRGFMPEKTGISYVSTVRNNAHKKAKTVPTVPALEPVAGDGKDCSPLPEEVFVVSTLPSSTPAQLTKRQPVHDWIIMTESSAADTAIKNEAVVLLADSIKENEPAPKEPRGEQSIETPSDRESDASSQIKTNRIKPGEFILVVE